MADNYLITGYWGEPHVTAENDRGINAAMFGTGRFVLPVGEQFKAEYIGNNTIRMYDGKLMNNGAAAGIPVGEYVDLLIANAGQGMNRNDIIVFQYSQDASTLIESGTFVVIQGAESSVTASDPALTQEDLLSGEASFDQMALWRVPVSGATISAPVKLFSVSKNIKNAGVSVVEATSSDGIAYSATVPGVTELYAGLEVTIIPNIASATTAPTLNINGLGAKNIRLPVSTNTAMLSQPDIETYYVDNRPVRLMYDPEYAGKGAWVAVGRLRQSGSDLYGTVPVIKGGTDATYPAKARQNLKTPFSTSLYVVQNCATFIIEGDNSHSREIPVKVILCHKSGYMCEIIFMVNCQTGVPVGTNFIRWGNLKVTSFIYETTGNTTKYTIKVDKSGAYTFGSLTFNNTYSVKTPTGYTDEYVFNMNAYLTFTDLTEGTTLTEATLV